MSLKTSAYREAFQTRISSFPVVLPDMILVNASPTPSIGHSPPIRGFNARTAFVPFFFEAYKVRSWLRLDFDSTSPPYHRNVSLTE